jgi:hypothetical protein
MTDFTLPPITVNCDARWIKLDLDGDLGAWARRTASDALSRFSEPPGGEQQERLATYFAGVGEIARRAQDASIVLLLYPVLWEVVRSVVRFCPVNMSGWDSSDEAWPVLLKGLVPDEPWEEPAEITELPTDAGLCHRIRRRSIRGDDDIRGVGEELGYCWTFPQYGAAMVMATGFANLQEAGMWRPVLDELASAVGLKEES